MNQVEEAQNSSGESSESPRPAQWSGLDDPEETQRCCGCECGTCMFPYANIQRHCQRCQEDYRRWLSFVIAHRESARG